LEEKFPVRRIRARHRGIESGQPSPVCFKERFEEASGIGRARSGEFLPDALR
jgi:hypothetical protein